jgi:hypothetical protein
MRSDLVFKAVSHSANRYQLCRLASKGTRLMHRPNTRIEDTVNQVLSRSDTFIAYAGSIVPGYVPNAAETYRAA